VEGLPRRAERSWWLEEALAHPEFAGPQTPPLQGEATADVVVLGGGYTGMWTAHFLKEREPALDVVLLESDICGGGPSGRNGGFVNGLYDDLPTLVELWGEEGRRACDLAGRSIDELGEWCAAHGVDAWYAAAGDLGVSTSPAQDAVLEDTVADARRLGIGDLYRPLSAERVRERFDSPVVRSGFLVGHAAKVQPARLARGLRRVIVEQGVRVFERTPVLRFGGRGGGVEVQTPAGRVRAQRAVLALGAYAAHLPRFRRQILPRGSTIVLSAPAPERLEAIGWTGGEGVYDLRTSLHYLRTTPDGRIAFGGAGSRVGVGTGLHPRLDHDPRAVARLVREFRRWFPSFADVPLEAAWGGPIDVSGLHLPFFGTLPGGRVHYGVGFTGGGVGPCHLAGKILSGLALGVTDEHTTLPLVGARPKPFPPEPLRSVGALLVQRAIVRADDLAELGRRSGPPTRLLARLPRRLGYRIGP
jgi:glycine/D-amino acid oxidase-like deaminating enzyme